MLIDRRTFLVSAGAASLTVGNAQVSSKDLFAVRMPRPVRQGRLAASDGQRIAWEVIGSGPVALVFVHGWMCDRSYWWRQAEALGRRYRVILPDLPGQGDSSSTRAQWTMRAYADDVARVANSLAGRRPVYLIGHSMGGVVVSLAAAQTRRLIGVCAVDVFTKADPPPVPAPSTATGATYVIQSRIAVRRGMFSPRSDPATADRIASQIAMGPESVAKPLAADMRAMVGAPALAALPSRTPLALINSDRHPIDLASLRSIHQKTELTVIEGVGHFVMLDVPERFNSVLDNAISHARAAA